MTCKLNIRLLSAFATLVALGMLSIVPAAQAANGGRIGFSGAIVAPTCTLNATSVQQAQRDRNAPVNQACVNAKQQNQARSLAANAYRLQVTSLATQRLDARTNRYFPQFTPAPGAMLATQTYL